jgi:hypothetical protein
VFVAICRGFWDRMGQVWIEVPFIFFSLSYMLLINLVLGCLEFPGESQRKQSLVQRRTCCSICKFMLLQSPCHPACQWRPIYLVLHCWCSSFLLWLNKHATLQVLDDTFASQMQQLLGNSIQQKELEPPRSIMEVRSILCKDAPRQKNSSFYYWAFLVYIPVTGRIRTCWHAAEDAKWRCGNLCKGKMWKI